MSLTIPTAKSTPRKLARRSFNLALAALGFASVVATSCVTVNVNFPESTVQKATDDYVKDLYEKKEKKPAAAPTPTAVFFSLIPSVYAADEIPTFKVESPKAAEIKEKMRANIGDIVEQKRNGNLGETNDGLLAIKAKNLPPLLEKKIEAVVKEQNAYRKDLYKEILRINGMNSGQISAIEKSFTRSFQSISPPGTWLEDTNGSWMQKQ